jgi:transposase
MKYCSIFPRIYKPDAYAGYNDITAKPDVIALACFSHVRRYFNDAQSVDVERANWMLSEIQKLYKLEDQARTDQLDHAARYQLRRTYAPCRFWPG